MYQPVSTSSNPPKSSHEDPFLQDEWEDTHVRQPLFAKGFNSKHTLAIALLISLLLNAGATFTWFFHGRNGSEKPVASSDFAGLTRTIPKPWTMLSGANETEQTELWDVQTNYDRGNIALGDEYAKAMGLPRAQRFPWDTSKGIYLINAYHNLHCIKTIRTALVEFRDASKQSSEWLHVVHCLMVLRDEIMCDADDTPRYTGFQPNQKSGLGQVRMCRDWKQLEAWADEHNACWRHVGDIHEPGFTELDRYRFCPEGSPYAEKARTMWLHTDQ